MSNIERGSEWRRKSNFFVNLLKFVLLFAVIRVVILWVGVENILALGFAAAIVLGTSYARNT